MVKTTSPFTGLLTVVLVVISLTSSITAYYESPAIVNGIHRLWESDSSSRNSPKTNSQPCWYIAVDKSLSLQTTISNDGRSVTDVFQCDDASVGFCYGSNCHNSEQLRPIHSGPPRISRPVQPPSTAEFEHLLPNKELTLPALSYDRYHYTWKKVRCLLGP